MGTPKNNWVNVNIARLRQVRPPNYLLDDGDILGIYIEGVLGDKEAAPPVHFPSEGSDLPPAVGYPVPVRENGTLPLPLIEPVMVRGLTLEQAERAIREAYIRALILQAGRERILVTLMRERQYRIMVVRQDGAGQGGGTGLGGRGAGMNASNGNDQSARNEIIMLPAYQNDVAHALTRTGGLPGVHAKNEVKIVRGTWEDFARRDAFVQAYYEQVANSGPCYCPPPLPEDPQIIRIPLRLPPGEALSIHPNDVILKDGDIVMVESRDREVFYTGGMLSGGEIPLPRDYDLDVLGAMALAGQPIGGAMNGGGGGGGRGGIGGGLGGIGGVPPGALYILRKTPCDGQMVIKVDLNRAIRDPATRILVQPEDVLILRYKPREELLNFGLGTFFTYGIQRLLQQNGGR